MPPKSRRDAWTFGSLWRHLDLERDLVNVSDREEYIEAVRDLLESNRFDWLFYPVASLGFLASSYSLFATSVIWPALAYVYRHDEQPNSPPGVNPGVTFDLVTLAGIILGMILFGHLADRVGRSRLYGLELIIITIATIGITFSSAGYMVPRPQPSSTTPPPSLESNANNVYNYFSTMNIFTAITCWRFLLGVGIGAEYPMSAIIAAECSSREWRGTTMAAVFLMQSVGKLMAFGFANAFLEGGLGVVENDKENTSYQMNLLIDAAWRFVAGLGGIFAVIAIALRLTMPESPKYIGCDQDLKDAMLTETQRTALAAAEARMAANSGQISVPTPWFLGAKRYLAHNRNWVRLATISAIWFCLDVCFYGTGLDSTSTLNLLWLTCPANSHPSCYYEDLANVTGSIFQVLDDDGDRTLKASSISSILGGAIVIVIITYVPRRYLLFWTSIALFVIFLIMGALVLGEFAKQNSKASLVFYALAQFVFNLGPNTVVFVLAAEIFPTMFRGTFYGIAAASGKAGAMLVRPFVQLAASSVSGDGNPAPLAGMLFAFGAVMLGVAFLTWYHRSLLEVQDGEGDRKWNTRLIDKDLDEIAPAPTAGELATVPAAANGRTHSSQDSTTQIRMYALDSETGRRVAE